MTLQVLNGPVIEAGEFLSDGLDCSGGDIVRITAPAGWSGANLTFQISTDGNGYNDLYTARGEEVTITLKKPGSAIIVLNEEWVKAINWLKIRSGTGNHPVAQAERREFAIAVEVADSPARTTPTAGPRRR